MRGPAEKVENFRKFMHRYAEFGEKVDTVRASSSTLTFRRAYPMNVIGVSLSMYYFLCEVTRRRTLELGSTTDVWSLD
jgi:hypothetical protein